MALINLDRPAEANERFREVATFSTDPDNDSENTLSAFAYRKVASLVSHETLEGIQLAAFGLS